MEGGTIFKKGGIRMGARVQAIATTTTATSGEASASSSATPPQPPVDYDLAPKDNLKTFIDNVETEEAIEAGKSLSDAWKLPDNYKFAKDQIHAWGTGFYIGNLVVATNAHCVLKSDKDQTVYYKDGKDELTRSSYFVFGYTTDAVNRMTIPANSVFMIERSAQSAIIVTAPLTLKTGFSFRACPWPIIISRLALTVQTGL